LHAAQLTLTQETLKCWDQYLVEADSQMAARVRSPEGFLRSAYSPDVMRRLRAGEIVAGPVLQAPKEVPDGLIHHWTGAAFIANRTMADVFAVVLDYPHYSRYYGPLVVDSKLLGHAGSEYTFTMRMMNHSLFSRSALEGEYAENYFRVSDSRWYSVAYSTRIQQIDDFGGKSERRLPPDRGSGYIWRVYSYSRFEERDGGVYVELDVIALSRDIPVGLGWVVNPIVRHLSRSSLLTSLEKTRAAVRLEERVPKGELGMTAAEPGCGSQ
jgi:hypothetical protein